MTSPKEARYHPWTCAYGFTCTPSSGLHALFCQCDHHSLRVPPLVIAPSKWYRNINLSSIGYAFRPRLRFRLTLGGFTVPRNPWVCGEQDSHLFYRYSSRHNHFPTPLPLLTVRLVSGRERSPTTCCKQHIRRFGVPLTPVHYRCQDTRPVSYYALFK